MKRYNDFIPKGDVHLCSGVTDSLLRDFYMIANQTRPNNAEMIFKTLQHEVHDLHHILLVYKMRDYVYGFITGHLIPGNDNVQAEARINWLFVEPIAQKKGIGSKLISGFENHLKEVWKVYRIQVQPVPTLQSKNFYTKHGYAPGIIPYLYAKDLSR